MEEMAFAGGDLIFNQHAFFVPLHAARCIVLFRNGGA